MALECFKRGCRNIREEKDSQCCKINRICNECGRIVMTITYQERLNSPKHKEGPNEIPN